MRKVNVLFKDEKAGQLIQHDDGLFEFIYEKNWVDNDSKPSISITLPKRIEPYRSKYLFPLFYNMLPEGSNKQIVCKYNKIDTADHFGILKVTANDDTIGAISVKNSEI